MTLIETPKRRPAHRAQGWRLKGLPLAAMLLLVVGAIVFLYPQAAAWTNQKNQAAALAATSKIHEGGGQRERAAQLEAAHAYNDALASGALLKANSNVPTGDGAGAGQFDYGSMLASPDGVMARIRYERAEIDLPVYHGTSDSTLLRGIGHLQGTSLPVGGIGTRAVLTGHRGLADATMFTHLDRAQLGDQFTLEVLGEALVYRVVDIQIIEPEDTEALLPDPDRDMVTLVTCTPLGVNTQRILVTGERVTPTPAAAVAEVGAPSDLPGFPWWAVALGAVLSIATGYVWWGGYPSRSR